MSQKLDFKKGVKNLTPKQQKQQAKKLTQKKESKTWLQNNKGHC